MMQSRIVIHVHYTAKMQGRGDFQIHAKYGVTCYEGGGSRKMRGLLVWGAVVILAIARGCIVYSQQAMERGKGEARLLVTAQGAESQGIRVLSGADGFVTYTHRGGSRCLTTQEGTQPASVFLYFDVGEREWSALCT